MIHRMLILGRSDRGKNGITGFATDNVRSQMKHFVPKASRDTGSPPCAPPTTMHTGAIERVLFNGLPTPAYLGYYVSCLIAVPTATRDPDVT